MELRLSLFTHEQAMIFVFMVNYKSHDWNSLESDMSTLFFLSFNFLLLIMAHLTEDDTSYRATANTINCVHKLELLLLLAASLHPLLPVLCLEDRVGCSLSEICLPSGSPRRAEGMRGRTSGHLLFLYRRSQLLSVDFLYTVLSGSDDPFFPFAAPGLPLHV